MSRFCIYCGKEHTSNNPVVDGVCLKCRLKRGEIISVDKKELRIDFCKVCGATRIGHKWVDTHSFEEALKTIAYEVLPRHIAKGPGVEDLGVEGYELVTKASWRTIVRIYVNGKFGGAEFTYPVDFVIYLNPIKCPRCIMVESGEYEAVVQIRGIPRKELEKVLVKEFSRDERLRNDLVDVIENEKGLDLYFFNHGAARKLARKLASRFDLRIKENYEIAGMRSGKQRARLFISLKA